MNFPRFPTKPGKQFIPLAFLLAGCSVNDAHTASLAQKRLLGMTELQLETCLGVPDTKTSTAGSDIFSYNATSTNSTTISVPVVGGVSSTYGGYCHTIVRFDAGKATSIRYVGETNAFAAPNAYCAPTVRNCVRNPPPPAPVVEKPEEG